MASKTMPRGVFRKHKLLPEGAFLKMKVDEELFVMYGQKLAF